MGILHIFLEQMGYVLQRKKWEKEYLKVHLPHTYYVGSFLNILYYLTGNSTVVSMSLIQAKKQ